MAWSIFTDGGGPAVAVGWATQFLKKIGAPVTPGNLEFVYQWEKSEGGGGKYNPLNQGPVQGKPYLTTTGEQYGGGAADFASWDAGLEGAYDFLHYSNYKGVLTNLQANNPTAARSALWASPWAASHYGYGSNWANVPLPGGQPVLPPSGNGSSTGSGTTTVADTTANCAWNLHFPVAGNTCLFSNIQARQFIGGFLLAGAAVIGLVGIAVLVAYSFQRTGAADKASQVIGVIPGAGAGIRAMRGKHSAD